MVPKTIALPLGYNPIPAELFTCRSTMEEGGFEPPNSERAVLQTAAFSHFATPPYDYRKNLTGVAGFEPTHEGVKVPCLTAWLYPNNRMEGEGFEPPNPKERIYSPPRLASSLPFQINI